MTVSWVFWSAGSVPAWTGGSIVTLGVIGLDEIALKKGHRNFVVIVTARLVEGRVVILAVLPDRQKDTVVEFLRSIPEHLKQRHPYSLL